MTLRNFASAPIALGTTPLVQLPCRFQSPLPSIAQVEPVGGTPGPSRSASSQNADCWPGTVPPPDQPRDTRILAVPTGATPLINSGVQVPTGGLEVGSIFRNAGVPIGLLPASSQVIPS